MKKSLILLTCVLLYASINVHADKYINKDNIVGVWRNLYPETRGLTQLIIQNSDTNYIIRAFGKCHPYDCDWGTVLLSKHSNTLFLATYENEFKIVDLDIKLISDKFIHVHLACSYYCESYNDYEIDYYMYRDDC